MLTHRFFASTGVQKLRHFEIAQFLGDRRSDVAATEDANDRAFYTITTHPPR